MGILKKKTEKEGKRGEGGEVKDAKRRGGLGPFDLRPLPHFARPEPSRRKKKKGGGPGSAGADDYLTKPFFFDELMERGKGKGGKEEMKRRSPRIDLSIHPSREAAGRYHLKERRRKGGGGEGYEVMSTCLRVFFSQLRRKIEEDPQKKPQKKKKKKKTPAREKRGKKKRAGGFSFHPSLPD